MPTLTKRAFEKFGFSTTALLVDWAKIVGPDLAPFTQPERLKWPGRIETYEDAVGDGRSGNANESNPTLKGRASQRPGATLIVRVDPARALDVQYQAAQIQDRINAHFGYAAVADMRILQAPVSSPSPAAAVPPLGPVRAKPEPKHGAGCPTKSATSVAASHIEDSRLRDALARLEASVTARK